MDETRQAGSALLTEGLVTDLRRLLEQQIAHAREGNLLQLERAGESAQQTVARITQLLREGAALSEESRHCLRALYRELMLVLKAESDSVHNNLKQLRHFKKVITAYRNGVD